MNGYESDDSLSSSSSSSLSSTYSSLKQRADTLHAKALVMWTKRKKSNVDLVHTSFSSSDSDSTVDSYTSSVEHMDDQSVSNALDNYIRKYSVQKVTVYDSDNSEKDSPLSKKSTESDTTNEKNSILENSIESDTTTDSSLGSPPPLKALEANKSIESPVLIMPKNPQHNMKTSELHSVYEQVSHAIQHLDIAIDLNGRQLSSTITPPELRRIASPIQPVLEKNIPSRSDSHILQNSSEISSFVRQDSKTSSTSSQRPEISRFRQIVAERSQSPLSTLSSSSSSESVRSLKFDAKRPVHSANNSTVSATTTQSTSKKQTTVEKKKSPSPKKHSNTVSSKYKGDSDSYSETSSTRSSVSSSRKKAGRKITRKATPEQPRQALSPINSTVNTTTTSDSQESRSKKVPKNQSIGSSKNSSSSNSVVLHEKSINSNKSNEREAWIKTKAKKLPASSSLGQLSTQLPQLGRQQSPTVIAAKYDGKSEMINENQFVMPVRAQIGNGCISVNIMGDAAQNIGKVEVLIHPGVAKQELEQKTVPKSDLIEDKRLRTEPTVSEIRHTTTITSYGLDTNLIQTQELLQRIKQMLGLS
jgi:hypothetical protein